MKVQWVRNQAGRIRGIGVIFGGEILPDKPFRICDVCKENPAIVFCVSDSDYVCDSCLAAHTMPGFCKYLSIRAAKEISSASLKQEFELPHEVHPWR